MPDPTDLRARLADYFKAFGAAPHDLYEIARAALDEVEALREKWLAATEACREQIANTGEQVQENVALRERVAELEQTVCKWQGDEAIQRKRVRVLEALLVRWQSFSDMITGIDPRRAPAPLQTETAAALAGGSA